GHAGTERIALDGFAFGCDRIGYDCSLHQPRRDTQHSNPTDKPDDRSNLRVVSQNTEVGKDRVPVVLHIIRISGSHQGQYHSTGIRHVGRGIQPILKEKERAKYKGRNLTLEEEISSQQKRNQPLQKRPTPYPESRAEPSEKQMAAFMDDQIR